VAGAVRAIAAASHELEHQIAAGPPNGGRLGAELASAMQAKAGEVLLRAAGDSPIAAVAMPHLENPVLLADSKPLLAAIDPLNGSMAIDANATTGTIFSLLPRRGKGSKLGETAAFLQDGERQLAAGFIVFGSRTSLVLCVREGTHIFTLHHDGSYRCTATDIKIPQLAREYAINASNYRHWDEAIRMYVDDCLQGAAGVRGTDFNMRWIGSLVAEIFRIFSRGGIYLYPADTREGHARGRLRLIFEANPIALMVEQAAGAATTGRRRILDITPEKLDERVPVIVGSLQEVDYVRRLYAHPQAHGERSPLFGRRGLFRV